MKLHYYPETDSLYIELNSTPGSQTREIVEGLNVDLDADGDVVGLDTDHASGKTYRGSRQSRYRRSVLRSRRDELADLRRARATSIIRW